MKKSCSTFIFSCNESLPMISVIIPILNFQLDYDQMSIYSVFHKNQQFECKTPKSSLLERLKRFEYNSDNQNIDLVNKKHFVLPPMLAQIPIHFQIRCMNILFKENILFLIIYNSYRTQRIT